MCFDLQPVLKGERLELRPLRAEDFHALFAVAADPRIWEQHPARDRYKLDVFDTFFREALKSGGALIALDSKDGEVIGSSRYHGYDKQKSEVEIGWTFLARSHWGGIYNGEMKRLMLRHAFRFVNNVIFLVGPQNLRSQRAVEKIGAVRAGSRLNGGGRESFLYQITAETFKQRPFRSGRLLSTRREDLAADLLVREATEPDLPAIVDIYNQSIPGGWSTADTKPITVNERLEWFRKFDPAKRPIWVAETDGSVVAVAYLSSFYGGRSAYDSTAEISVYIARAYQRRGIGRWFKQWVIEQCPRLGVTTLLSMHFDHNEATRRINQSLGFQQQGHLTEIAVVQGQRLGLIISALRIPPTSG
jgi:phosphinothricin acetyltransferase